MTAIDSQQAIASPASTEDNGLTDGRSAHEVSRTLRLRTERPPCS